MTSGHVPVCHWKMARSKDILQAIDSAHAMGARSPISVWMRENYDEFAARLVGRRADWRVLARVFAEAGLTDNAGKPATPEAVRKTWQRVVSARARNCGAATAGRRQGCRANLGGRTRHPFDPQCQASLTTVTICRRDTRSRRRGSESRGAKRHANTQRDHCPIRPAAGVG